ncbi:MAG: response regulator transcription factor [Actinomycetota bacterium]|nr:response regulator transcription factor [Actinomycetota bacterium]
MVGRVNPKHPGNTKSSVLTRRLGKANRGAKRLLFVEGHPFFREGLALLLKWRKGFESVQAESLAEACRVLNDSRGKVDLAIVDLDLSDGLSLIERIREIEPDIPVLALTSRYVLERNARALRLGADEVLSTATEPEELIGAVERLATR